MGSCSNKARLNIVVKEGFVVPNYSILHFATFCQGRDVGIVILFPSIPCIDTLISNGSSGRMEIPSVVLKLFSDPIPTREVTYRRF
jgi:hypothetical protein